MLSLEVHSELGAAIFNANFLLLVLGAAILRLLSPPEIPVLVILVLFEVQAGFRRYNERLGVVGWKHFNFRALSHIIA